MVLALGKATVWFVSGVAGALDRQGRAAGPGSLVSMGHQGKLRNGRGLGVKGRNWGSSMAAFPRPRPRQALCTKFSTFSSTTFFYRDQPRGFGIFELSEVSLGSTLQARGLDVRDCRGKTNVRGLCLVIVTGSIALHS